MTTATPLVLVQPVDRRARLAAAVERMELAIATGERLPVSAELEALALVCAEAQLYVEAWRVRGWMAS